MTVRALIGRLLGFNDERPVPHSSASVDPDDGAPHFDRLLVGTTIAQRWRAPTEPRSTSIVALLTHISAAASPDSVLARFMELDESERDAETPPLDDSWRGADEIAEDIGPSPDVLLRLKQLGALGIRITMTGGAVWSALDALDVAHSFTEALFAGLTVSVDLHAMISSDLETNPDRLLAVIQVRNFWPGSAAFAPADAPARAAIPPPGSLAAGAAGEALDRRMWRDADDAVRLLLGTFDIVADQPSYGGEPIHPPSFYVAWPTGNPRNAEQWLDEPFGPTLRDIAHRTIVTTDPVSSDVSGGLLEGHLLVLARTIPGKFSSHYLLVPWQTADRSRTDIERSIYYLIRELSLFDFQFADLVSGVEYDVQQLAGDIELYTSRLANAMGLINDARDQAAVSRGSRGARMLSRIHAIRDGLARIEPEMLDNVRRVQDLRHRIGGYVDERLAEIRQRLTLREIGPLTPLIDGLRHKGSDNLATVLSSSETSAVRMQDTFDRLQQVLSTTSAAEAESAARRTARVQRFLGLAVAALTIVTVVPVLVGSFDFDQSAAYTARWLTVDGLFGAVGQDLAQALREYQTHIEIGATLIALLAVVLLLASPLLSISAPTSVEAFVIDRDALHLLRGKRRLADERGRRRANGCDRIARRLDVALQDRSRHVRLRQRQPSTMRRYLAVTEFVCNRPELFRSIEALLLYAYVGRRLIANEQEVLQRGTVYSTLRRFGLSHAQTRSLLEQCDAIEGSPEAMLRDIRAAIASLYTDASDDEDLLRR